VYPIQGNHTICNIKSLVSNEISFSSIKFLVHLNIKNIVNIKMVTKFIKLRQRIVLPLSKIACLSVKIYNI
jgi:hypothetical protein